jgi:hypothetical protein
VHFDWNERTCWTDLYRAALKRRRARSWRCGRFRAIPAVLDRVNRTTITIGMIFAGALLFALLVPV